MGFPFESATSKGTAPASRSSNVAPPPSRRVARNRATPTATAPPARIPLFGPESSGADVEAVEAARGGA